MTLYNGDENQNSLNLILYTG